jgi:hypothetical protein
MLKNLGGALRARWPYVLLLLLTGLVQSVIGWTAIERASSRALLSEATILVASVALQLRGHSVDIAAGRAGLEHTLTTQAALEGVVEAAVVDADRRLVIDLYGRWTTTGPPRSIETPASLAAGTRAGLPGTRIHRAGSRYLVAVPIDPTSPRGAVVIERESRGAAPAIASTGPWTAALVAGAGALVALLLVLVPAGPQRRGPSVLARALIALALLQAVALAALVPVVTAHGREDTARLVSALSLVVADRLALRGDGTADPPQLGAEIARLLGHVASVTGVIVADPLGRIVVEVGSTGPRGRQASFEASSALTPPGATAALGSARYQIDRSWPAAPRDALLCDTLLVSGLAALGLCALAIARARPRNDGVDASATNAMSPTATVECAIAGAVGLTAGLVLGEAVNAGDQARRLAAFLALAVGSLGAAAVLAVVARSAEVRGWRGPTLLVAIICTVAVFATPLQLEPPAATFRAVLCGIAAVGTLAGLQARLIMLGAGTASVSRAWTVGLTGLAAGPGLGALSSDLVGVTAPVVIASALILVASLALSRLSPDRSAPIRLLASRPTGSPALPRRAAVAVRRNLPIAPAAILFVLTFAIPALLPGDRSGAVALAECYVLAMLTALATATVRSSRLPVPRDRHAIVGVVALAAAALLLPAPVAGAALAAGLTGVAAGMIVPPWILNPASRQDRPPTRDRLSAIGRSQGFRTVWLGILVAIPGLATVVLGPHAAIANAILLIGAAAIPALRRRRGTASAPPA